MKRRLLALSLRAWWRSDLELMLRPKATKVWNYNYDLIIPDLMLPGLSGTGALRIVRQQNEHAPERVDGLRCNHRLGAAVLTLDHVLSRQRESRARASHGGFLERNRSAV